uniref:Movement protein n=1 Tax=Fig latent virus 1 TaxID=641245 RepID=C6GZ78_9VIRU|nr:movement protein [Fig latent virus 1]
MKVSLMHITGALEYFFDIKTCCMTSTTVPSMRGWIDAPLGSSSRVNKMSIYKKSSKLGGDWLVLRSEINAALDLELKDGLLYSTIPFAPRSLLTDNCKYGYIHWGQILVEVVALHQAKDHDCLLVLHDDRWEDPPDRLIKCQRFKLKQGPNSFSFRPDFLVSLLDTNAMESLRLSIFVLGLRMKPGSKPIAVKTTGIYKAITNLTEDLSYRQSNIEIRDSDEDAVNLLEHFPLHSFEIEESTFRRWGLTGPKRVHNANIKRVVQKGRGIRFREADLKSGSTFDDNSSYSLGIESQPSSPHNVNGARSPEESSEERNIREIDERRRLQGSKRRGQVKSLEKHIWEYSHTWILRGDRVPTPRVGGGGSQRSEDRVLHSLRYH